MVEKGKGHSEFVSVRMPGPTQKRPPVRSQSLQNVIPSGHAPARHASPDRRNSVGRHMGHSTSDPQLNQNLYQQPLAPQQYQQYQQQNAAPEELAMQYQQIPSNGVSQIPVPQTNPQQNGQLPSYRRQQFGGGAPMHETVPEHDELAATRPWDVNKGGGEYGTPTPGEPMDVINKRQRSVHAN